MDESKLFNHDAAKAGLNKNKQKTNPFFSYFWQAPFE